MRNRIAFLIFSILLSSCGGNGNKSKKNQEITDMDSTESVVIDTMVTSPIESKEKAEESTRVKSKDPIVGTFYCSRSGDTYVFNNDKTGMFTPNGGSGATFNWRLKGKIGAPDKPCGVGCADANPKLLLNDT